MLEIRDLKKNYGKYQVLNGLDMTVPDGSLFGFVGPNGKPIPLTEEEVTAARSATTVSPSRRRAGRGMWAMCPTSSASTTT